MMESWGPAGVVKKARKNAKSSKVQLKCSSSGAVADHPGAVTAVVGVGAELNHPHKRLTATAATGED